MNTIEDSDQELELLDDDSATVLLFRGEDNDSARVRTASSNIDSVQPQIYHLDDLPYELLALILHKVLYPIVEDPSKSYEHFYDQYGLLYDESESYEDNKLRKRLSYENARKTLAYVGQLSTVSKRFYALLCSREFDELLWYELVSTLLPKIEIDELNSHRQDMDIFQVTNLHSIQYQWGLFFDVDVPCSDLQPNTQQAFRWLKNREKQTSIICYREALKDAICVRNKIWQKLCQQCQRQQNQDQLRHTVQHAPYSIVLSYSAILLCVGYIMITLRQILEWKWTKEDSGYVSPKSAADLRVLHFLTYVLLVPISLVPTIFAFLTAIQDSNPNLRRILVVLGIAFCFLPVGLVLLCLKNMPFVEQSLSWSVTLIPFAVPIVAYSTVQSVCYWILADKTWSVVFGCFCFLTTLFLFLVSMCLSSSPSTGFHVGFTYVPLALLAIVFMVVTYKQRRRERIVWYYVALPVSLVCGIAISTIWNSYAICLGNIFPTIVAYICLFHRPERWLVFAVLPM